MSGNIHIGGRMDITKGLKASGNGDSAAGLVVPNLAIRIVSKDDRGSINTITHNGMEYTLIETKAGNLRGGDYHPTAQHAVLLNGDASWTLKLRNENGNYSFDTRLHRLNTDFVIPPMIPHFMNSISDSLMVVWLEGGKFEQRIDHDLREYMKMLMRK
jgi:hemin uptake protein HemP